jgi:hypothetical protein
MTYNLYVFVRLLYFACLLSPVLATVACLAVQYLPIEA